MVDRTMVTKRRPMRLSSDMRTTDSLRHTYATFRLLYGKANTDELAQNMGTSPQQKFNHYRHITIRQKATDLGGKLHSKADRNGLYL
jgi:integrase